MSKTHFYAANRVATEEEVLKPGYVEIDDTGEVVRIGKLDKEMPFTEWLGGTIDIVATGNGKKSALHNRVVL